MDTELLVAVESREQTARRAPAKDLTIVAAYLAGITDFGLRFRRSGPVHPPNPLPIERRSIDERGQLRLTH